MMKKWLKPGYQCSNTTQDYYFESLIYLEKALKKFFITTTDYVFMFDLDRS